ncbi:hypothetical protein TNIN_32811 [Trichonephila inaurata madagascariensis]|uniref:Transposase Tc1-like domain-containing protein n=1 Tax=Trichonephila inaurata madagascariensis TaxID=2747483 RepID=A0A8X6Y3W9_9ARAC|nr:hypothetical protein TNIN_32811 [Trichonephila inaurata madagascariensis]
MRGNVLNKSRCGRPHKLSDRDARAIVRKVKKNPKISAPKLADQIATASGKKVHPETVRRIIRSGGYNGRVSSRKPFISSVKQQKRRDSASPHVDKERAQVVSVSDDSKVETQTGKSENTGCQRVSNRISSVSGDKSFYGCASNHKRAN